MALLLREAIGGSLRRARTLRKRTLRDVSRAARVSLGYLSEVERGRKEPSSELLAAICEALDIALPDLLAEVIGEMTRDEQLEFVGRTETLVPIGQRHTDLRLAPVRTGALGGSRPGAPVASAA
ncbi:helix-turn-helix domain-containing protein [Pseudonocardia sp. RS010]|uniref:helix-turn-helix domain-containing protein n=1 Tax=Pseudonocardia sp. RS010 TaxID=3385979 RepID=UPI0039A39967